MNNGNDINRHENPNPITHTHCLLVRQLTQGLKFVYEISLFISLSLTHTDEHQYTDARTRLIVNVSNLKAPPKSTAKLFSLRRECVFVCVWTGTRHTTDWMNEYESIRLRPTIHMLNKVIYTQTTWSTNVLATFGFFIQNKHTKKWILNIHVFLLIEFAAHYEIQMAKSSTSPHTLYNVICASMTSIHCYSTKNESLKLCIFSLSLSHSINFK